MSVIEILTWLAGAGAAAASAFLLERIASFQNLSANGKQMVAFSIAVVIGALAIAPSGSAFRPTACVPIASTRATTQATSTSASRAATPGSTTPAGCGWPTRGGA